MSMSDAQEKQHLEESINQILNDAYSDLIKLEYLDTAKVEEITEIIIASLVKPRIMRIHKDQLQLFDPSAYNYEGSD
jgi:hypothetical protein